MNILIAILLYLIIGLQNQNLHQSQFDDSSENSNVVRVFERVVFWPAYLIPLLIVGLICSWIQGFCMIMNYFSGSDE
jgi:hypothetical protein